MVSSVTTLFDIAKKLKLGIYSIVSLFEQFIFSEHNVLSNYIIDT